MVISRAAVYELLTDIGYIHTHTPASGGESLTLSWVRLAGQEEYRDLEEGTVSEGASLNAY